MQGRLLAAAIEPAAGPRSYGTVEYRDGVWHVTCEPHVAMRLKRVFGKANQRDFGTIKLTATTENSRDLEWFMQRYPMDVVDAQRLDALAREYDRRGEIALEVMTGKRTRTGHEFLMALPPRGYQSAAAALALANRGLLVGDDLGIGKTVTAITMLADPASLPALVAVPAHIPEQWADQCRMFLPHLEAHVVKKAQPYSLRGIDGAEPDILISSYHKLSGWADVLAGKVRTVVFDECQELRRRESQKYAAARHLAREAEYRMGLSATPIYNYGDEFWSVMDVLAPGSLGSYDEFVREWCSQAPGGKWKIRDPRAFGSYLREAGLMLRRTRKEVARELPSLNRVVQEIHCDTKVLDRLGADDLARIIIGQGGGWEKLKAASEFDMRMRQATGIGKAPYVAEFVRMLLEDGDPVLLYGWHRAVYDIWAERLREFRPAFYTGTESPERKRREVGRFLAGDTPLIIMSLRSGAGLDGLQRRCSRVVFGELDWSPGVLEQCIGRVHRDGQPEPVFAYYLTTPEGSDPVMMDVLGVKRGQVDGVREPFGELSVAKEVDPDHIKHLAEAYLARHRR